MDAEQVTIELDSADFEIEELGVYGSRCRLILAPKAADALRSALAASPVAATHCFMSYTPLNAVELSALDASGELGKAAAREIVCRRERSLPVAADVPHADAVNRVREAAVEQERRLRRDPHCTNAKPEPVAADIAEGREPEAWPNLTHQMRDKLNLLVQEVGISIDGKWLSEAACEAIETLRDELARLRAEKDQRLARAILRDDENPDFDAACKEIEVLQAELARLRAKPAKPPNVSKWLIEERDKEILKLMDELARLRAERDALIGKLNCAETDANLDRFRLTDQNERLTAELARLRTAVPVDVREALKRMQHYNECMGRLDFLEAEKYSGRQYSLGDDRKLICDWAVGYIAEPAAGKQLVDIHYDPQDIHEGPP